jgi:Domain of unknown function (DUF4382)
MVSTRILAAGGFALLAVGLGACSNGGGGDGTGSVSVSLMDRPVDGVTELHVTISEVWLKPKGDGPAFELPMTSTPLTVDLLDLDDQTASVLVDEAVVPAGSYNWIEIKIEDADISDSYAMTTAGGMVPVDVDVPSGKLRLVSGFEVGENQAARFLFDWDVRKGLSEAVGRQVLLLRPAFRILDVDEYGVISGSALASTIAADADCQAVANPAIGKVVYVFEGDVTPGEIDGIAPEPLTTVKAVLDPTTGDYDYRAIVMPGDYTVAFTCEGDLDTDAGGESLGFIPPDGTVVTVTAATPVEVDF